MRDSARYEAQAIAVMRLADRAEDMGERRVYLDIADGWRRLAAEAERHERRTRPPEPRSFKPDDD
jgi:hypothetical protein